MCKVTVLIPTLNSMEYMDECIKSVMRQTLQNIEIIVIDAGSTDGTVQLVESYQKTDDRIVLVHSEKKSYGYQLNKGITLAKGDYIGVVESDDFIEADMYETLLRVAVETKADFVKGNHTHYAITSDKQELKVAGKGSAACVTGKVFCPSDYPDIYLDDYYLWRGIYNKSFLMQNNIVFNESAGAAYQDVGFLYQTFVLAKKAFYLDRCFYHYRRNNAGSSTYSPKAFAYLVGEYTYLLAQISQRAELQDKAELWDAVFYRKLFVQMRSRFRLLTFREGNEDDVKADVLFLQKLLKDAYESKKMCVSVWDMQSQVELFMMLEDIQQYLDYCRMQTTGMKKCLQNLLNNLKTKKEIVLVGDGKMLPFVYTMLKENELNHISCICDNDSKKWQTFKMGCQIVPVEKVCETVEDKGYLITSIKGKKALINQLMSLGVAEEQIYIYDQGVDWLYLSCM